MFIGFRNGEIVTRTAKEKRLKPTIKDTSKNIRKGVTKMKEKMKDQKRRNKKMVKEIYRYSNPHPEGKSVTDCVVRAITIAVDGDYLEVRKHLNRVKKELKETSYKNKKFMDKYAKLNDWKKISFPAIKGVPRLRGKDFVKQYPEGIYILKLAGHVVTVVDGVYLDTWDSTEKMIYKAWEVN